jgi:hypothetical protein
VPSNRQDEILVPSSGKPDAGQRAGNRGLVPRLAAIKVPRYVIFVDSLPQTATTNANSSFAATSRSSSVPST